MIFTNWMMEGRQNTKAVIQYSIAYEVLVCTSFLSAGVAIVFVAGIHSVKHKVEWHQDSKDNKQIQ